MYRKFLYFILIIPIFIMGCGIEENEDLPIIEEKEIIGETKVEEKEVVKNKELFEDYYDKADKLMETMTLEEKVSQMFLARYPENGVVDEIKNEMPGGYVLFARDFKDKTKNDVINEINNNQDNSKIKMFMAVDEEGGTVVRVSGYKEFRNSKFKSPMDILNDGGIDALLNDSTEKTSLLKSLGINMNLAPVADIPSSSDSYMYKRAISTDEEEVTRVISLLVNKMKEDGIISCLKHFPGYGDNVDTHTGIALDERSYDEFAKKDLKPFINGINNGAPSIMVNHNIIKCIDDSKPASLSTEVHNLLREELNYSGIIMTDALDMDAVKSYVENGEAVVQAILCGNDMVISSSLKKDKEQVMNAIEEGRISEEKINEAVRRILACKYMYGII